MVGVLRRQTQREASVESFSNVRLHKTIDTHFLSSLIPLNHRIMAVNHV